MMMNRPKNKIRVALVVPHIFLHHDILPHVIFSPGTLALDLATELTAHNVDVTIYSPGPIDTSLPTVHSDLSYFESELEGRGDTYIDLLKKHPFTFVSLARQVQSELIAKAYATANSGGYDLVHIYTNEEDIALPFAKLCSKPVVFTHHDPFNFMVKYKNVFPKYSELSWLSISFAQREGMPANTNWVGNIYHGLDQKSFTSFASNRNSNYVAYLGRIIEPKGVHLAIDAINLYNKTADIPLTLKIAGKHYADAEKDTYWQEKIVPKLNRNVEYVGFIKDVKKKNEFLGGAKALIIPSTFNEPFGMVMIEALASGTPIIGLNSGAIPEIITKKTGILVKKSELETETVNLFVRALDQVDTIDRQACRDDFEARFTLEKMCKSHISVYKKLIQSQDRS